MGLSRYKFGAFIEQIEDTNRNLQYGSDDVRGMTITKEIIPTKANIAETDLSHFIIIRPGEFIYNPRTHGKKIGLGYNNTTETFIISWNNIGFRIKSSMKNLILSDYIFFHFNRFEWDREACFNSWGSSTEVFSWETLCNMEIDLPPLSIQQKYVDIYNAMLENQKCYEKGLDDLKLICDATIENCKRTYPISNIEKYITRVDERNIGNKYNNVKNVSVKKEFSEVSAKVNKNELSSYKIVKPRQISFVQTTHNEHVFCNALNNTDNIILVTSVNEVFECDENNILPEYLCMNFNRTEFDRYVRYNSWGSARETFTWNSLCAVKIPLPDINIQKSICNIYSTYKQRKVINEKLKSQIKNICPILIKGSIEEAKRMEA